MYLSQTNGPAYARVVGCLGNSISPFNRSPWEQDYNSDYLLSGDFPFGYNPVLISDPMLISDICGLPPIYGQSSAEGNLFAFERPQRDIWSYDNDSHRYGSPLDVVNQIRHLRANSETPRENGTVHRHYSGTVRDLDIPLFDYHTGSQHGIWAVVVPTFDSLDPYGVAYREIQSTGFNSDGYLEFITQGSMSDSPGSTALPTTDYWSHTRLIKEKFLSDGFVASLVDYGDWPSQSTWPDRTHLLVWRDYVDNSIKVGNTYFFDISYVFEKKYHERGGDDLWVTSYDVHVKFSARFNACRGTNNPFLWNSIPDEVFTIVDDSTVSVRSSDLDYFGNHYSRYPVDEVTPPRSLVLPDINFHQTYHSYLFSTISQSAVGERSRLFRMLSFDTPQRDPGAYAYWVSKKLDPYIQDFRATSFYSASDALHKNIDVLSSNNIQNLQHLSGLTSILPDLPEASSIVAKLSRRDPDAIFECIDFLSEAILKYRFEQAPLTRDAKELLRSDISSELADLIQSDTNTIYGEYHYSFTESDMSLLRLPGRLELVTRSKIRVHTDVSTLLAGYFTANGVGLFPTLSRLWSVVPFSFVVDWFTGMSKRLQKVDDQLLWMALDTNWCLHSYKYTYYPSTDELAKYGLVSSVDEPFGLTFYRREFSRLMPHLMDARFDYLAPTHGPDPLTVGALVWQFL